MAARSEDDLNEIASPCKSGTHSQVIDIFRVDLKIVASMSVFIRILFTIHNRSFMRGQEMLQSSNCQKVLASKWANPHQFNI